MPVGHLLPLRMYSTADSVDRTCIWTHVLACSRVRGVLRSGIGVRDSDWVRSRAPGSRASRIRMSDPCIAPDVDPADAHLSALRKSMGLTLADFMKYWKNDLVLRTTALEGIQFEARAIAEVPEGEDWGFEVDGQWLNTSVSSCGPTWVSMTSHVDVAYDFVADDHDGYCSEMQYRKSRTPPRTGVLHVQVPLLRCAPLPEDPDAQEAMFRLPLLTRVPHHGVCGCTGYSLSFSQAVVVDNLGSESAVSSVQARK